MSDKRQNIQLPGGGTIFGVTDEQARILTGRRAFVERYCGEHGWDMLNLTIEQLLEVRSQPKWKNPVQGE